MDAFGLRVWISGSCVLVLRAFALCGCIGLVGFWRLLWVFWGGVLVFPLCSGFVWVGIIQVLWVCGMSWCLGGGFGGLRVGGLRVDGFGLRVWVSGSFVIACGELFWCVYIGVDRFLGRLLWVLWVGFWQFLCVPVLHGVGIIQIFLGEWCWYA